MADDPFAFPRPASEDGDSNYHAQGGMSLRDYFAAKAMVAFIPAGVDGTVDDFGPAEIAQESYRYADAMLAERAKLWPA